MHWSFSYTHEDKWVVKLFLLPPFSFSSPFSSSFSFFFFLLTPSLVLFDCSYLTRNKYNLQFNFVFSWYTIKNIYAYGVPYTLHEINTIFNLILSLVDISSKISTPTASHTHFENSTLYQGCFDTFSVLVWILFRLLLPIWTQFWNYDQKSELFIRSLD